MVQFWNEFATNWFSMDLIWNQKLKSTNHPHQHISSWKWFAKRVSHHNWPPWQPLRRVRRGFLHWMRWLGEKISPLWWRWGHQRSLQQLCKVHLGWCPSRSWIWSWSFHQRRYLLVRRCRNLQSARFRKSKQRFLWRSEEHSRRSLTSQERRCQLEHRLLPKLEKRCLWTHF